MKKMRNYGLFLFMIFAFWACSGTPKSSKTSCNPTAFVGQEVFDASNADFGTIVKRSDDCNMTLIKNVVASTNSKYSGQFFYIVAENGMNLGIGPQNILNSTSNANLHDDLYFPVDPQSTALNDIDSNYLPRFVSTVDAGGTTVTNMAVNSTELQTSMGVTSVTSMNGTYWVTLTRSDSPESTSTPYNIYGNKIAFPNDTVDAYQIYVSGKVSNTCALDYACANFAISVQGVIAIPLTLKDGTVIVSKP